MLDKECKTFVWIFGIIFSVLVVVQHFELPYGSKLSSLVSSKASFIKRNYSPSAAISDDLNSTYAHAVPETRNTNVQTFMKDTDLGSSEKGTETNVDRVSDTNEKKGNAGLLSNQTSVEKSVEQSENSTLKDESLRFSSGTALQGNLTRLIKNSTATDVSAVKKTFNMSTVSVMPISMMNELLQQSHSLHQSLPAQFCSKTDKELLNARSQIENVPIIKNNATELYAPLYRNASKFKRSYEIMDEMLKVYIYKEGEKPIFHDSNHSILGGIYASEGWFLKLLEANKQFVTEDPREAHLFYLPFSSRLLQLTLYVRHSHNRDNLIQYMKNYVEMLVEKYPFWNRCNGADHFLAACHDWAPAETRGRMLNCIRALCNADIKTGFNIGKDVSIPTTYVRSAQNPQQDIGGDPPLQRPILAFFAGYMHGNVRSILLQHWGNDSDMRIFGRMPHVKGNKNYIQHMKSSKYCICARGFAVHSPRVVESIFYECVPVIISDNYVPPLFEVLNWKSFAVFVLEKDIPNLKKILLSISEEKYIEMQKRVKRVQEHFVWHSKPVKYDLFHMILHSIWYNRVFRISHT